MRQKERGESREGGREGRGEGGREVRGDFSPYIYLQPGHMLTKPVSFPVLPHSEFIFVQTHSLPYISGYHTLVQFSGPMSLTQTILQ